MKKTIYLTVGALLALGAVHAQADVAVNTQPAKASLAAAKARKNGFTPIVAKKGGANANLAFRIEGKPVVGQPLTIRITMASNYDAQISLTTDQGLVLSNASQVLQSAAGRSAEHSIIVVPNAQVQWYVNLFTTVNGQTSASAIAVQVGDVATASKTSAHTKITPNGERVQIMKIE
jgi:hypothetical protein